MKREPYIPHAVSARNNSDILFLIESEGASGYGVYWTLMEYLCAQEDYIGDIRSLRPLARQLKTSVSVMLRVLNDYGLFIVQDGSFQSPRLNQLMQPLESKRKAMNAQRTRDDRATTVPQSGDERTTDTPQPDDDRATNTRQPSNDCTTNSQQLCHNSLKINTTSDTVEYSRVEKSIEEKSNTSSTTSSSPPNNACTKQNDDGDDDKFYLPIALKHRTSPPIRLKPQRTGTTVRNGRGTGPPLRSTGQGAREDNALTLGERSEYLHLAV